MEMASNVTKSSKYVDRCGEFEKTEKLICYICPKSLQNKNLDSWEKHVREEQHLFMLESFNKSFWEINSYIVCKLCLSWFVKQETVEHAISHKLLPWYKTQELYHIFVEHFIARIVNKYYCHLCKELFSFWQIALSHINDSKHRFLQKDKINGYIGGNLQITLFTCKLMINHSIFPQSSKIFECMACNRLFHGYRKLKKHIKGKWHQLCEEILTNKLKEFSEVKKQEPIKKASFRKSKKKYEEKCSGSTGRRQPISLKKEKLKKLKLTLMNKESKAVIPAVHVQPLSGPIISRAGKKMSLQTSLSEAQPENTSVIPNQQLNKVCYEPNDTLKCEISCPKCDEKVRDYIELHMHLSNHFRLQCIQNQKAEENQPNTFTNENVLNGLVINCQDETQYQGNNSSNTNIMPSKLNKLFKQLTNNQPSSVENENNIADMFNNMLYINEIPQICSIDSKNEKNTIIDHTKTEQLEPAAITFNNISELQFFSNLNKQLSSNIENITEELNVMNEITKFHESLPDSYNNEAISLKSSSRYPEQILKSESNIQYNHLTYNYVYEIDNKQLQAIERGIIFTFTRDENNIYCMICRKNIANSVQNLHEHLCNIKHNRYLEQMHQDHSKFATFPSLFSDLHLALHFMEEISDLCVKCWACNEEIQNDNTIVKQHIDIEKHQMNCKKFAENSARLLKSIKTRMTRDWYNVQLYWCVACDIKFQSEFRFVKHLSSIEHNENCWRFKALENFMFDFCPTCAALWFGFHCTFAYHCECKMHKYHVKDDFYNVSKLPNEAENLLREWFNMNEKISKDIDQNLSVQKLEEERLLQDLLEVAQEKFYRVKVHPFGSRISGLASQKSDLDVFIDCDNMYNKNNLLTKVKQCLKALEESLKNQHKTWKINKTVIDVEIPFIKIHHKRTGIACNIFCSNGLSVENTKLITNYIEMYPLCRNLIIFMKKWISVCNLAEFNGFTNYALSWMVIYYLQKQHILPSVAELIRAEKKSKIIAGWETGVKKNFHVRNTGFSFIQLLQGFFITYSQFDYRHEVICPSMGESIQKKYFKEYDLPDEMWPYMSRVSNQKNLDKIKKFDINTAICVQDPFELSRNLTKNVEKLVVHKLRSFCTISAEILQNHS